MVAKKSEIEQFKAEPLLKEIGVELLGKGLVRA
jgi:hypothetical protein